MFRTHRYRRCSVYNVFKDTYEHYRQAIEKVVGIEKAKQIPHPFLKIHTDTPKDVLQAIKDAKKMASGNKKGEKRATESMHV